MPNQYLCSAIPHHYDQGQEGDEAHQRTEKGAKLCATHRYLVDALDANIEALDLVGFAGK